VSLDGWDIPLNEPSSQRRVAGHAVPYGPETVGNTPPTQLARQIDQRRLELRQGRESHTGWDRKGSSQENTNLCPYWKEVPGVYQRQRFWWQDRVEIREGTIFMQKKKDAKTDVDLRSADHRNRWSVLALNPSFHFGCVRYGILLRT